MTNFERTILMVVMRALLALFAGFVVLVAVATFARPEPGPCRDTVTNNVAVGAACAAPTADTRLVLTTATAATALTWFGSGVLKKRLVHA